MPSGEVYQQQKFAHHVTTICPITIAQNLDKGGAEVSARGGGGGGIKDGGARRKFGTKILFSGRGLEVSSFP